MAYVVPKVQSIMFDGTNNAEVEALITNPYFAVVQSDETRIKWQNTGEMEATYATLDAGEWLLYQDYGAGGTGPVTHVSDADYQARYHEIS